MTNAHADVTANSSFMNSRVSDNEIWWVGLVGNQGALQLLGQVETTSQKTSPVSAPCGASAA